MDQLQSTKPILSSKPVLPHCDFQSPSRWRTSKKTYGVLQIKDEAYTRVYSSFQEGLNSERVQENHRAHEVARAPDHEWRPLGAPWLERIRDPSRWPVPLLRTKFPGQHADHPPPVRWETPARVHPVPLPETGVPLGSPLALPASVDQHTKRSPAHQTLTNDPHAI
jgi:hypothetical protein